MGFWAKPVCRLARKAIAGQRTDVSVEARDAKASPDLGRGRRLAQEDEGGSVRRSSCCVGRRSAVVAGLGGVRR